MNDKEFDEKVQNVIDRLMVERQTVIDALGEDAHEGTEKGWIERDRHFECCRKAYLAEDYTELGRLVAVAADAAIKRWATNEVLVK